MRLVLFFRHVPKARESFRNTNKALEISNVHGRTTEKLGVTTNKNTYFLTEIVSTALENSRIPSGSMSEISIVCCFLAGTVCFKGMYTLTDWRYNIYILFTNQNHVLISSLKTSQDFLYGFKKMAIVVDSQAY